MRKKGRRKKKRKRRIFGSSAGRSLLHRHTLIAIDNANRHLHLREDHGTILVNEEGNGEGEEEAGEGDIAAFSQGKKDKGKGKGGKKGGRKGGKRGKASTEDAQGETNGFSEEQYPKLCLQLNPKTPHSNPPPPLPSLRQRQHGVPRSNVGRL